jgi:hypothetical protein
MTIILFFPRHLRLLKWGLLFDERRGYLWCLPGNLLLVIASTVILVSWPQGTHDRIFISRLSHIFFRFRVNCCWPSPAELFLVPGSAEPMTMFFCLTTEERTQFPAAPLLLCAYWLSRKRVTLKRRFVEEYRGHKRCIFWRNSRRNLC